MTVHGLCDYKACSSPILEVSVTFRKVPDVRFAFSRGDWQLPGQSQRFWNVHSGSHLKDGPKFHSSSGSFRNILLCPMTLEVFRDIPADSERLCMLTNYSMAFRQILEDSIMGCGPECSVSRTFRKVPQVREYFVGRASWCSTFFSLSYSDSPHFSHHSDTLLVHFHAVVLPVSKIDLDLCCLCSPS